MKFVYFISKNCSWGTTGFVRVNKDKPNSREDSLAVEKTGKISGRGNFSYDVCNEYKTYEEVSFGTALLELYKTADLNNLKELFDLKNPPVMVGGYTVENKSDGIQVGCTFVPDEIIKRIAKERKLV